jgi:hypothetical protein
MEQACIVRLPLLACAGLRYYVHDRPNNIIVFLANVFVQNNAAIKLFYWQIVYSSISLAVITLINISLLMLNISAKPSL